MDNDSIFKEIDDIISHLRGYETHGSINANDYIAVAVQMLQLKKLDDIETHLSDISDVLERFEEKYKFS